MIDPGHIIHTLPLERLDYVLRDFAKHAPELLEEACSIVLTRRGKAPPLPLEGGSSSERPRYPGRGPRWRAPMLRAIRKAVLPAEAALRASRLKSRRALAAACHLPQSVRQEFTTAGLAVMAVIAMAARGAVALELTIGELAARSFTSPSTVRAVIDKAEALGLLANDDTRRRADGRNLPNRIRILCRTWIAWLRKRLGLGSKKTGATGEKDSNLLLPLSLNLGLDGRGHSRSSSSPPDYGEPSLC